MKKGFTLLELLIVIGILAILSTTMVLVINPAELLKKARDSQRISDLNTLKTAISYYLTNASSISMGVSANSYSHVIGVNCADIGNASSSQAVDGTGWIPVKFTDISEGSPIPNLPIDPNPTESGANPGRYYVYIPNTSDYTFELLANMESLAYSSSGPSDVESKDGGNYPGIYEVGTKLGLATISKIDTKDKGSPLGIFRIGTKVGLAYIIPSHDCFIGGN